MSAACTRIKFCGITRVEDAHLAAALNVDFLGFIFVPGSPRHLTLQAASALRSQLPAGPKVVALVQNAPASEIANIRERFAPDLFQFHGIETPEQVRSSRGDYLRAVPMGSPQRWSDWERDYPDAVALLADSHTASGGGGSGIAFGWAALPPPTERLLPLMLAGGLRPETVGEAVLAVRPWAVDVSSGIESAKGIKDARKMRAFVAAVRAADAQLEL